MSRLAKQLLPPALDQALTHQPGLWLVGGAIRDHFAQRPHPDLDLAVDGPATEMAREVADRLDGDYFTLDPERDVGRVILEAGRTLDFVRLRGGSIEADLALRDFTVNAMATPIGGGPELIDPLHGLQDLRDRRLVPCSSESIRDDPVRALRGIRLAHQLRLRIPSETADLLRRDGPAIAGASPERLRDELVRALTGRPGVLRLCHQLGCLAPVLPEIGAEAAAEKALGALGRMREVLEALGDQPSGENIAIGQIRAAIGRYRQDLNDHLDRRLPGGRSARQILLLAALYLPIEQGGKLAERRMRQLRFSRREGRHVRLLLELGQAVTLSDLDTPSRRQRLVNDAGAAGAELVLLALASQLAVRPGPPEQAAWHRETEAARRLLAIAVGEVELPVPLIDGHRLMAELELAPGPTVGQLLSWVYAAQVDGELQSAEQAIGLARRLLVQLESGDGV